MMVMKSSSVIRGFMLAVILQVSGGTTVLSTWEDYLGKLTEWNLKESGIFYVNDGFSVLAKTDTFNPTTEELEVLYEILDTGNRYVKPFRRVTVEGETWTVEHFHWRDKKVVTLKQNAYEDNERSMAVGLSYLTLIVAGPAAGETMHYTKGTPDMPFNAPEDPVQGIRSYLAHTFT